MGEVAETGRGPSDRRRSDRVDPGHRRFSPDLDESGRFHSAGTAVATGVVTAPVRRPGTRVPPPVEPRRTARPRRPRTFDGWLLGAFALAMVAPLVFAGKVFFFRDFGLFYHPVRQYFLDRVLDGSFPLWAPEINCGTPLHAEMVHGFLYPPNLLLLFGPALGWGLYFSAHLALAGLGARRLALRFGAPADAALAAGVAFAGSGYLVAQMNHVPYASAAAWAPLVVSLVMDLRARRRSTTTLLAVCLAMAALAGEPFTVLLTVLFAGIVILGGFAGPRWPALLRTGVAGVVALLLASPALLPGLLLVGESARAGGWDSDPAGYGSLHPIRFATLLAPEALGRIEHEIDLPIPFLGREIDIYPPILLGIHLGALTVVAAVLAPLRKSRAARWLLATALGAGVLSLGSHALVADWLARNVPGLDTFRYPDKYWFAATLAAAPLLAVSLPHLRPGRVVAVAFPAAAAAFFLGLATVQVVGGLTGAAAFLLVAAAARVRPPWRTRALTAVLAAELLFFGIRMGPVTEPENLGAMQPDGLGAAMREEAPGRIYDDFDFPGEKGIRETSLLRYRNLQSLAGLPDGFRYSIGYDPVEPIARIAWFFNMPGDTDPALHNRTWHRILRLSATTHSITNKPVREDAEVVPIARLRRSHGIQVLRYRRPAARARLYGDVDRVPDWETARRRVQDPEVDPFRTLVLEGEGEPVRSGPPHGRVRFEEDGAQRIVLSVESDRAAWLFLADSYARGWRATVDGEPTPIECADVAFRAVRVPAGTSRVEFVYAPVWRGIVPFTAGAGLLLLLVPWLPRPRSARRRSSSA